MNGCLEHLLLVVALAEKLGSDVAGLGVALQAATVGLDLKLLFWRDLNRQPFTKIHFLGAEPLHDADAMPEVQP